ncbi:MAG: Type IV fimbrial biogenesis protein PilY1 [Rhodanobacteraceae bacterium]|jgi:type IV pilus assembly protein PilY1|nr:MAG: Type IV fimbrial biogenesis protein PilY1 [Rhodanobacteraceae bacterium]
MNQNRQTILASRPAAMVLALSLVTGLTAPFVMLSWVHPASAALPCAQGNNNGCTELSPTPPQDTIAVPPNIMLMMDDSGSMNWSIMPDYSYLSDSSLAGMRNNAVNGVYYNPTIIYSAPPKADSTTTSPDYYPSNNVANFPNAYANPFFDTSTSNVTRATGSYGDSNGSNNGNFNFYDSATYKYNCHKNGRNCSTGNAYAFAYVGAGGSTYHVTDATSCTNGKFANCIAATDTSGVAAPAGVPAGQNVMNWYSYYSSRIQMMQSGLMSAFSSLNPRYRFGFGSINGRNNSMLPAPTGVFGPNSNKIAEVQPFGDGTAGTQKASFWNWVASISPSNSTPLRLALQAVGQYYQTSSQPWSTMSSDPGYTSGSSTVFACRSSYTILTTDGFWNDSTNPSVGNADNTSSGPYSVPSGNITGYAPVSPFMDSYSNTLADVAMYYWKTDLQTGILNEVAGNKMDPATWQHMATFTMGLGFAPSGITGTAPNGNNPPTVQDIFNWSNDGGGPGSPYAIKNFSWPQPAANSLNNIADLAHAAVNGHGDFFSVKSPQDLAAGFSKAIAEISARTTTSPAASVNASVVAVGAIGFETSYNTGDWSGTFNAYPLLPPDGTPGTTPIWTPSPNSLLDSVYHSKTGFTGRVVYTGSYNSANTPAFTSFQLTAGNSGKLDAFETAGLQAPALAGGNDTLTSRINYLLGDNEFEGAPFRTRTTLLGAIINAQPVYVGYPTGNYFAFPAGSPEATAAAASSGTDDQAYDSFVARHATRAPTVYLGANDGMLHAFNAPVPQCTSYNPSTGVCSSYNYGTNPGKEDWAFVPRAVYANLGNLTNANFQFRPTVDATPVTRDVFFGGVWHTMLAGGVGLGGRGVYALDITGPANSSTPTTQPTVLWEFDSDMTGATAGCASNVGTCNANDLGYTVSQPNIGRLANGKWVVLVPNGYFPDCNTPDIPTDPNAPATAATSCQSIAKQAPGWSAGAPYSALFVLDAQTGAVLAELKTPQIAGVTSYGLATPVMGDYNNDQIDDVAFAGDAMGNLWRFDLSGSTPSSWTVTLAYKGGTAKDPSGKTVIQPITSMPRLFPDPVTNRFMVVFGTGRFLGVGDNSNTDVQAIYGVRDQGSAATSAMAYTQSSLVQQYLHETVIPAGATLPNGSPDPNAGASLRCVTGSASDTCQSSMSGGSPSPINPVPASAGGWYINLQTKTSGGVVNDAGERVVVNPGAIFASNTVVFETLITGSQSSDPCSPTTVGSIMALSALTGGSSGVSSLGGGNIVGGRINNARTSGSLPLMSALGGGQVYLPGTTLAPNGTSPLSIDAPIWRRRSWQELNENQ